ncbi:MAG: SDR family oxidoreductase [Rhodocyclaceae bacterium]|nr:SDR family oxidoreductase [Rhodocyclaceae bacterium]
MDLGIAGKIAFVAGGSKGMGRSVALTLGEEGCHVGVVARGRPGIDAVVEEIKSKGGSAVGISADLCSRDDVNRAVAELTKVFGAAPDIVVGQTSDMTFGGFDDVTDEDIERVFRTFTMAQVYLARATLPAMQAKKWGRYIHIGAPNGREPEFGFPHLSHNIARPSTVAFLRTLANSVARDGVTINTVAPGYTETPTLVDLFKDEFGVSLAEGEAQLVNRGDIPMGRLGQPEEIAGLVTFLASKWAGYITGEWIIVAGGKHRFAA